MKIAVALLATFLIFQPAFAKLPPKQYAASQTAQSAPDDLIEQGSYVNSDGKTVHSPAHTRSGKQPSGATAKCGDGSYSFSQHHRGTCSRHGGVAEWL